MKVQYKSIKIFNTYLFSNLRFQLVLISDLIFIRLIPESVRWLESKDDHDKVKEILNEIATINNTGHSKNIQALVKRESCKNVGT